MHLGFHYNMIQVVNKYKHKSTPNDFYIGRGSVFGNPYTHLDGITKAQFEVATREEAIEKYREWFNKERVNNPHMYAQLHLMLEVMTGWNPPEHGINLVCYCAPQACHGGVIKEYLESALANHGQMLPPAN